MNNLIPDYDLKVYNVSAFGLAVYSLIIWIVGLASGYLWCLWHIIYGG